MGFTNSIFGALLGVLAVSQIMVFIIKLLLIFFEIYIFIRIFDKARQPIYYAIIPIVNRATLLKIANMNPWWAILSIFSIICSFVEWPLIALIVSILELVIFGIAINIKLAEAFDYSIGFAIGMMFFPLIFYSIVAFGSCRYTGTKAQKKAAADVFKLNGNQKKGYVPKSDFFRD